VHIPEEVILSYQDVMHFRDGMHHLYVQAKKDLVHQELPTNYRLTVEEVHAIINDWEDDWKNPTDKPGSSQEDEDQGKSEEEEGDQTNGAEKHPGQSKFPEVGLKRKDQEPEQTEGHQKRQGEHERKKKHSQAPFCILTDDDMDRIGYLIHDSTEELWGEAVTKHEDQQKKVQDQLGVLQQLLETTCIVKDPKTGDDPSTTQRTVEASAQEALIQPSGEHHTIHLEAVTLELPVGELQEQIAALGQLSLVISRLPIQRVEELQAQLVQEIRHRGDMLHTETWSN
jgi:hypothetical protein